MLYNLDEKYRKIVGRLKKIYLKRDNTVYDSKKCEKLHKFSEK